jgi:hypothetical protein
VVKVASRAVDFEMPSLRAEPRPVAGAIPAGRIRSAHRRWAAAGWFACFSPSPETIQSHDGPLADERLTLRLDLLLRAADSLGEAGGKLFTFTRFPKSQWKSIRTSNAIERLHEEFKRRIKTQTVLPSAETAAMLFWALLASGQITMRKVDGWRSLAEKPSDQIIDLAAWGGNIVTREIAPNSIPTQIATPPPLNCSCWNCPLVPPMPQRSP